MAAKHHPVGISPRGDPPAGDVSSGGRTHDSKMNSAPDGCSGSGTACYRIVVRGEVTERYIQLLEGVVVESAGAESVLRVQDADQARLLGVVSWLYDRGVELVSVRRAVDPNPLP